MAAFVGPYRRLPKPRVLSSNRLSLNPLDARPVPRSPTHPRGHAGRVSPRWEGGRGDPFGVVALRFVCSRADGDSPGAPWGCVCVRAHAAAPNCPRCAAIARRCTRAPTRPPSALPVLASPLSLPPVAVLLPLPATALPSLGTQPFSASPAYCLCTTSVPSGGPKGRAGRVGGGGGGQVRGWTGRPTAYGGDRVADGGRDGRRPWRGAWRRQGW